MENISGNVINNELIIQVDGVVDSNNAQEVEKTIFDLHQQYPQQKLVLDIKNLTYISSAGLRIILKLKKQNNDFKIINASTDVYEIFSVTGFSEMMTIEKVYKDMSVDGCEAIGEGSNGIVYRYNKDTVIKVYKNPDALADIQKEKELARKALILGVNTAISYDVVKVNNLYASIFEMVESESLMKLLNKYPENFEEYMNVYISFLKQIHQIVVRTNDMPNQKEVAVKWVEYLKDKIDDNVYNKLYKLMSSVDDSHTMIHGDYHMRNIHYHENETTLIDMDTLAYGNKVFEFAPMFLAYVGFGELDRKVVEDFIKIDWDTCQKIWKRSLELYFETTDKKRLEEIENKAKIIAYTRLLRRTIKRIGENDEFGARQIAYCKMQLEDLVKKVDDLSL